MKDLRGEGQCVENRESSLLSSVARLGCFFSVQFSLDG